MRDSGFPVLFGAFKEVDVSILQNLDPKASRLQGPNRVLFHNLMGRV